jgi:hypothetical protein
VTGAFDQATRAAITALAGCARLSSGYLNKLQHKALLTEIVATTSATSGDEEKPAPRRRASGGGGGGQQAPRPHSGGADPGAAFVGGVVGGMLGGAFRR